MSVRGASPYAEVTGSRLISSPAPPTGRPEDPRGFILALERALRMAGVAPQEVDCIPDALEAEAYERIFGGGSAKPLITSIKGATGEIFASGGIPAAALVLSLRGGIIPPTVGFRTPLYPLPFVIGKSQRRSLTYGLLSGISFGGTYACLVMKRL